MQRATSSPAMAGGGGASSREGTAKAIVAEQLSQSIQSTSNLLHLMQQSSPSQAQLVKLPKNLLAKASTIKNTRQVLEQMPQVISSLDAHTESGLQRTLSLQSNIQQVNWSNSEVYSRRSTANRDGYLAVADCRI